MPQLRPETAKYTFLKNNEEDDDGQTFPPLTHLHPTETQAWPLGPLLCPWKPQPGEDPPSTLSPTPTAVLVASFLCNPRPHFHGSSHFLH